MGLVGVVAEISVVLGEGSGKFPSGSRVKGANPGPPS